MKLSICIPIYNYDVRELVTELSEQAQNAKDDVELILIDDASREEFRTINEAICCKETYIKLDSNIGRAKIRNLFLEYTSAEYLLFLDCDVKIISKTFISKYLSVISETKEQVVCGGRIYPKEKPKRNHLLSWKYGVLKESKPFKVRQQSPNASFMTNNFVVHRTILEQNKFDERLENYGHEDTLFGYRLKQKNITISHIDNPVLNIDIETNAIFLEKTEMGIVNLISILDFVDNPQDFTEDVVLLRFYNKLKSKHLISIIYGLFFMTKPIIKTLLINGMVNIKIFDFYKLGLLIEHNRNI